MKEFFDWVLIIIMIAVCVIIGLICVFHMFMLIGSILCGFWREILILIGIVFIIIPLILTIIQLIIKLFKRYL